MPKRRKKTLNFHKYLGIILAIITTIALSLIYFIDILPQNYFIILCIVLIIITLILIRLLKDQNPFLRALSCLISILYIIVLSLGITYELNTLDFFKQFGFNQYKTENYEVIVLSNSLYQDLSDLQEKRIGYLENQREGLSQAIQKLTKEIKYQEQKKENIESLLQELKKQKIDAIFLEENELQIFLEENELERENIRTIYTIEIEIENKKTSKEVDITKTPFTIYLSGMDTYGKITKVSRSDVNMLITINPLTNQILLTNIPRDYYVNLADINEFDKLTHAGIYGITSSVKTIEQLLDISINYYVKVNFTSLIDIVDEIGGIEVDSPYEFTTIDNIKFAKGKNKLDGQKALSFSRERKAFLEGDRIRGENQQRVLTAIINKLLTPTIIMNYNDLLTSIKDDFITDLDDKQIRNFIKEELKSPQKWQIKSASLNGTNEYQYTYSYKKNKLYVMKPSEESIKNAQENIKTVLSIN